VALQQPETIDVRKRYAFSLTLRILVVTATFLAAGCSRFGNPMLQFSPASFPECKGPDIVVHVSWNATGKTKGPVNILVYKPGHAPTVWTSSATPKGQQDTGAWMSDGSTMRLVDAKGRLLAMRTLVTTPCD
jgi:hypothetical protein